MSAILDQTARYAPNVHAMDMVYLTKKLAVVCARSLSVLVAIVLPAMC